MRLTLAQKTCFFLLFNLFLLLFNLFLLLFMSCISLFVTIYRSHYIIYLRTFSKIFSILTEQTVTNRHLKTAHGRIAIQPKKKTWTYC